MAQVQNGAMSVAFPTFKLDSLAIVPPQTCKKDLAEGSKTWKSANERSVHVCTWAMFVASPMSHLDSSALVPPHLCQNDTVEGITTRNPASGKIEAFCGHMAQMQTWAVFVASPTSNLHSLALVLLKHAKKFQQKVVKQGIQFMKEVRHSLITLLKCKPDPCLLHPLHQSLIL